MRFWEINVDLCPAEEATCLVYRVKLVLTSDFLTPPPISCQVTYSPGGRARPGPRRSLYQIWVVCPTWRIGKVSYWSTCTITRIRAWASREWAKPQACVHMTLPPHSSSSTWLMCRMAGRFCLPCCLIHTQFLTGFCLVHRSSHFNTQTLAFKLLGWTGACAYSSCYCPCVLFFLTAWNFLSALGFSLVCSLV